MRRIGNQAKLEAIRAYVKFQALYSKRGEALLPPLDIAENFFAKTNVRVISDQALMRGELLPHRGCVAQDQSKWRLG